MSAALLLVLGLLGGDVTATWRCTPSEVELGEPFTLVLELEHPADVTSRELDPGEPALDATWVVLDGQRARTEALPDGRALTRCAWSVASLEPGERALAEVLSGVALSERVTRVRVGDARVRVTGVLAEGEDAPRGLREFPEGFAAGSAADEGVPRALLVAGGLVGALLVAGGVLAVLRRRRRTVVFAEVAPLERLSELERELDGEHARESCFELTRLVRSAVDRLRRRGRPGLDDEEWLREVAASHDVPRGIVEDLERLFARTTRVKYAGEQPTGWALKETFQGARAALEALDPGRRNGSGRTNGEASA